MLAYFSGEATRDLSKCQVKLALPRELIVVEFQSHELPSRVWVTVLYCRLISCPIEWGIELDNKLDKNTILSITKTSCHINGKSPDPKMTRMTTWPLQRCSDREKRKRSKEGWTPRLDRGNESANGWMSSCQVILPYLNRFWVSHEAECC